MDIVQTQDKNKYKMLKTLPPTPSNKLKEKNYTYHCFFLSNVSSIATWPGIPRLIYLVP